MCSLHRDDPVCYGVPLKAHIKLVPSVNHSWLKTRPEFTQMVEQCETASADVIERVAIYNEFSSTNIVPVDNNHESKPSQPITPVSSPVADEEIEQLYDYIRGFASMPKSDGKNEKRKKGSGKQDQMGKVGKPPLPPIETMPSRKSVNSGSSGDPVRLKIDIRPSSLEKTTGMAASGRQRSPSERRKLEKNGNASQPLRSPASTARHSVQKSTITGSDGLGTAASSKHVLDGHTNQLSGR